MNNYLTEERIENTIHAVKCSNKQAKIILKEIERQQKISYDMGFADGKEKQMQKVKRIIGECSLNKSVIDRQVFCNLLGVEI